MLVHDGIGSIQIKDLLIEKKIIRNASKNKHLAAWKRKINFKYKNFENSKYRKSSY